MRPGTAHDVVRVGRLRNFDSSTKHQGICFDALEGTSEVCARVGETHARFAFVVDLVIPSRARLAGRKPSRCDDSFAAPRATLEYVAFIDTHGTLQAGRACRAWDARIVRVAVVHVRVTVIETCFATTRA